MIEIVNEGLKNYYIEKHRIKEIFSKNTAPKMRLVEFKKNDLIYRDGENIDEIYFFVSGKAKVYITLKNGKSLLIGFYDRFKILGDLELTTDSPASTNVQVLEDSLCIGISFNEIQKNFMDDSVFLRYICNSLSEKLRQSSNNSTINLLYPLEDRLASYIIMASKRTNDSLEFSGNLMEVSELLGTSYRHLLRTFEKFSKEKILEKRKGSFFILDEDKLRSLSADLYR